MNHDVLRRYDDPGVATIATSSTAHSFARQADVPLLRPNPGRLSEQLEALQQIEASGIFSNYGPVNTQLEAGFVNGLFAGQGSCVTVCNATIGLMMAIRAAIGWQPAPQRRYALMPSFTFAATAHAAQWVGLTPLLCDVDPQDWTACAQDEDRLLARYGDEIAVLMPCTTFGNPIDLARYDRIFEQTGIPVVIDAAAALGSIDWRGQQFATGTPHSVVFSMHATKTFASAEGGLIYSGNAALIENLRVMGNFGFGAPRSATMPGLNSKMAEVTALLALLKLNELDAVVRHRDAMTRLYREMLPELQFQRVAGQRQSTQFVSVLLPTQHAAERETVVTALNARGVGTGTYFSPHLAEQSWFAETCHFDRLPVTDAMAVRVMALPMSDLITAEQVFRVCDAVRHVLGASRTRSACEPAAAIDVWPHTRSLTMPGPLA